jgi:transposase
MLFKGFRPRNFLYHLKNKDMKEEQMIFIGIDVSRNKLDVHCFNNEEHFIISNNAEGLSILTKWLYQHQIKFEQLWLVFEFTGMYCHCLCQYCKANNIQYSEVPAMEIQRTMGITRGKNDKVDAKRIAIFAQEKQHKLKVTIPVDKATEELKRAMSLRDKLVGQRAGYMACLKEMKHALDLKEDAIEIKIHQKMKEVLDEQIKDIEKHIKKIIATDEALQKNYNLLVSVKGVGFVIAVYTIIYTANFTKFTNCRKFACYCGIAPFENSSGTITRRSRVSHLANKKIKSVLSQGARSASIYDAEIKQFYERKLKDGKSNGSVMNIIKNKLVARMFAVIHKQKPYEIKNVA